MIDRVKIVILATTKSHTMLEDKIFEDEILEVEPEQDWLVAESPSTDCISIIRKDTESFVFIRNFMMKY